MMKEEWTEFLDCVEAMSGDLPRDVREAMECHIERLRRCSVVEWQTAKADVSDDTENDGTMPVLHVEWPEGSVRECDVTELFEGDIFASMPWPPEES